MGNPINLLTLQQQGTDSATAMAMMNNNPWMYLVKHFWFHDDDMGDPCDKVYWYFEDWIYG